MKLYIPLMFLLSCLFSSCSETECCVLPPEEDPSLVGVWQLSKLCFSNGATSCDSESDMWEPDYSECLTYREDGLFTIDRDGVICNGTFELIADTGFTMTANESSDCIFENIEYQIIKLSYDQITISPLCIEGCPQLYVRKN